jgi:nucleoside-diphosphate-sugar epimerase
VRVLLAGATGVIGRRLLPILREAGHQVAGMTRSPAKADALREAGAEAVICDALDAGEVRRAVAVARPEVVVNHLTDLPLELSRRKLKRGQETNNRIRAVGGPNLAAAARDAGARRIVAQSIAFLYAPEGGPIKDESAPLHHDAPPPFDESAEALLALERATTGTDGVEGMVLRFGFWYGTGTTYASDGYTAELVRRRRFPIVGDGTGMFSFSHVDDVASATIAALDGGEPGIYNVTDDEPAPVSEWLPAYAEALGAPPPRRAPTWLASLLAGRYVALMLNELRGATNAKARRELGWSPRYESWRRGFREALG